MPSDDLNHLFFVVQRREKNKATESSGTNLATGEQRRCNVAADCLQVVFVPIRRGRVFVFFPPLSVVCDLLLLLTISFTRATQVQNGSFKNKLLHSSWNIAVWLHVLYLL